MILKATSIDRELGGRTTAGCVLSRHDRAVYLEDDRGGLIALVREAVGNGPGYVLVADADWPHLGCGPEDPFDLTNSRLTIAAGRVVVDCSLAGRWDPIIQPAARWDPAQLRSSVDQMTRIARLHAGGNGLGYLLENTGDRIARTSSGLAIKGDSVLIARIVPHMQELVRAAVEGNRAPVTDAAHSLIGLGDGLTPSGDDLLVGLLAIMHAIRPAHPDKAWMGGVIKAIADAIASGGSGTTPVARHFLSAAARGGFVERTHDLVKALVGRGEKSVARATERVIEYGATSGIDLIVGIIAGIKTIVDHGGNG